MPSPVRTNLRLLAPSRERLRSGDVFTLGLPDNSYLFGRVIVADRPSKWELMAGANLVYIYDVRSASRTVDVGALTVDRLLIPPLFINRLPWSRGYFETVEWCELDSSDVLPQHYFWSAARGGYVDEDGEPVQSTPPPPVGDWGLHSFRTVDDAVSEAVGIPPVSDDA